MSKAPTPPDTDSPWFWLLAFSLMALLALAVVAASGKYGKRQATIERHFQARQRVAERLVEEDAAEDQSTDAQPAGAPAENNLSEPLRTNEQPVAQDYSSPDNTLLPLWPLGVILLAAAGFAVFMLRRELQRSSSSL